MSMVWVLKPNFLASCFVCFMSVGLYVSCSGSVSASTLLPPMASDVMAAVVELSIPPDKPSTIPLALVFLT